MYFKVLNEDGTSCNGGKAKWSLPVQNEDGTWTPGEWFWQHVKVGEPGKCWPFLGRPLLSGYGQLRVPGGKRQRAHRAAYELCNGLIPSGLLVCHHCDNPICCNPTHLYVGTQADNMKDCTRKGRYAKGARNGMKVHPESHACGERAGGAKLVWEQVRAIRERYAAGGVSSRVLAKEFQVGHTAILEIVRGAHWRNP